MNSEIDEIQLYIAGLLAKMEQNNYNLCLTGSAFNSIFKKT